MLLAIPYQVRLEKQLFLVKATQLSKSDFFSAFCFQENFFPFCFESLAVQFNF